MSVIFGENVQRTSYQDDFGHEISWAERLKMFEVGFGKIA
jgi:hypothetical protein